ncbi:MAG: hypothetical protein ACYC35_21825 [Pirellulales bacterium]
MRRIAIAGTVCTGLVCFIGWHIAHLPATCMPVAAAQLSQSLNSRADIADAQIRLPLPPEPGFPLESKPAPAVATASETRYPSTGLTEFERAAQSPSPARPDEDQPRVLTVADLKADHPLARVITPAAARRLGIDRVPQPDIREAAAAMPIQRLPPVEQVSIAEPQSGARSLPQEPIAIFP